MKAPFNTTSQPSPQQLGQMLLVLIEERIRVQGHPFNSRLHDSAEMFALIDAGADLTLTNFVGSTALLLAAEHGITDCLHALLAAGADHTAQNRHGATALIEAAGNGHVTCLRALLNAGADIDAEDKYGATALVAAIANKHTAAIKVLLLHGADPNKPDDKTGNTPLMRCAWNGHDAGIELLLKAGADPALKNKAGLTAADWAVKFHLPKMAQRLGASAATATPVKRRAELLRVEQEKDPPSAPTCRDPEEVRQFLRRKIPRFDIPE